jgi:peptidoglycan/xylan/chitin deacetylase (PgdA/CDA1 family)
MLAAALLKSLAGRAYLVSPPGRRALRRRGTVLMLHRVLESDAEAALPHRQAFCVGRRAFEHLLCWLRRNFDCVPLQALLEQPDGPRPRVALTLDDGWRDNAEQAFPLLLRYAMPASIFLATDFIGITRRFWWEAIGETLWQTPSGHDAGRLRNDLRANGMDAPSELFRDSPSAARSQALFRYLHALKSLPPATLQAIADPLPALRPDTMNWEQVRALESSGLVRFGPHGASHAILPRLDAAALDDELTRSRRALHEHCRHPLPVYCYPNGDHDERIMRAVAAHGYRYALTTKPGLIGAGADALALPRIDVGHIAARHPARLGWRLLRGARA